MSDFGISRRLKRVRSASIANSELDAELQASIRTQSHASKRSRVASGGRSFSGSFVPGSKRTARQFAESDEFSTPKGDLGANIPQLNGSAAAGTERSTGHTATARVSHRGSNGAMKSLWSSMSGFFGRDKAQPVSVRETVSTYESLQSALDRPGSSSNNSNNSPRDSGIYLDSRPSSRLKFDGSETVEQHAFDPQFSLEPPKLPAAQPSESPLKRLQTASISGLRKVKSLALRPQPSREDMQKEQCHLLMRRMSNLQSQLDECKQEFSKLFGDAAPAEVASAHGSSLLPDPASPKSDRGTQTVIKFDPGYNRDTESPLDRQQIHGSIESAADEREATPEDWPLPAQADAVLPTIEGPALRRVANTRSLRTPEAQVKPVGDAAATLVERAPSENVEPSFLRRSLSTIPSSGDEKSPTPEKAAGFSENERPSSARSNKTSRIPTRQSPRKTRLSSEQQQQQLLKVTSVRSSKDGRVTKDKSPRTLRAKTRQAGKASPGRRGSSSSKRLVDSADVGHYDEHGEWVWGPEAF